MERIGTRDHFGALRISRTYLANTFQNGDTIHIDATVCIYVLVASCVSALLFGILPALQAARLPIQIGLREGFAGYRQKPPAVHDARCDRRLRGSALIASSGRRRRDGAHSLRNAAQAARIQSGEGCHRRADASAEELLVRHRRASTGKNMVTTLIEPMLTRIRQLPGVTAAGVTTVRPLRTHWTFLDESNLPASPKPDPTMRRIQMRVQQQRTISVLWACQPEGRADSSIAKIASAHRWLRSSMRHLPARLMEPARRSVCRSKAAEAGSHKYATIVGVVADARQDMNESVKPELLLNLGSDVAGS